MLFFQKKYIYCNHKTKTMLIHKLILERKLTGNNATYGHLSVITQNHGTFKFTTIENTNHEIQNGTYNILYTHSPKFNRKTLELTNVKGRTGIRIHSGNRAIDFSGCIGVGLYNNLDEVPISIYYSKISVEALESLLWNEAATITIK